MCDNGQEFTRRAVFEFMAEMNQARPGSFELSFIEPGKPIQNCLVESFNGRMREECLSQQLFLGLDDSRRKIEVWRRFYGTKRPLSSLGMLAPEAFTQVGALAEAGRRAEEKGAGRLGRGGA